MPIKEAEKSYDHKKIENKVQNFWKEGDMFSKVNKLRANGPQYSFLGLNSEQTSLTANGRPEEL